MYSGCGRLRVLSIASLIGFAAAIAACGGGGGGGGNPVTAPPIVTPTSPTTPGSQITTASGTVVDDGTGQPIAGVSVKLMPWATCAATPAPTSITPENDGCPTPLPSPQATTNAQGQFSLGGVANGHYLLVIGADAVATVPPGYTTPPGNCGGPCPTPSPVPGTPVQGTVHDNVTLTGGNQTLKAPTLPSVPVGLHRAGVGDERRLPSRNAQEHDGNAVPYRMAVRTRAKWPRRIERRRVGAGERESGEMRTRRSVTPEQALTPIS